MADLRHARTDLAAFADAIEQRLAPWQAAALALKHRTNLVVAPRQSGKSRSLAVLALWRAFSRPDQHALVVSASESASRRLLAEAAAVAIRSPLLAGSVTDENSGLLKLSNGSTIRSVPASERAIRGWSVDLLVLDEAAQISDELIVEAALPTTAARPDARVVLASSPGPPEGIFYDLAESASDDVHVAHWTLEDAMWIAPEVIEHAREQLPPAAFAREFLGQFTDAGEQTIIERDWITAAQQRTLGRDGSVVYGVDLARGGDESVAVRFGGGQARVVWSNREHDLMRVAELIVATLRNEIIEPPALLDVTGLGHGVHDRCRELGANVQPFVASGRAYDPRRHLNMRAQAWFEARDVFRNGQIDLDPADKVLAAQLAAQRFTIAPSGALQVASKEGQSNSLDRADALVLAIHARARHDVSARVAKQIVEQARDEGTRRWARTAEEELADEFVPLEQEWSTADRKSIVPSKNNALETWP